VRPHARLPVYCVTMAEKAVSARTRQRITPPKPDADEKAPSSGPSCKPSLMYFYSGEPMLFLSGVDNRPNRVRLRP
jgi:hypothetical protein